MYPGSLGSISGVALAGKIWYTNANANIISIPIHHTGKLLLITANADVNLSVFDPILLLDAAPNNIPIIEIIMVAVVNSNTVFGIFSTRISPTLEDPVSLVRKVALPKAHNIICSMV